MAGYESEDTPSPGEISEILRPRILIINMFPQEAEAWHSDIARLDLTARRVSVPGLWTEHREILCTENGDVCQIVTGEGLINASLTMSALISSPLFDLTKTYFLIAGISGVNPRVGTIGAVAFAKYAVQFDLQYEFDAREIPPEWSTGYVPQGSQSPGEYPSHLYGTEVYALNHDLLELAEGFAKKTALHDSHTAGEYRRRYARAPNDIFRAASMSPSVIRGDVVSANVFFHGHLLSESARGVCSLFTAGRGVYCMTAQEDNGTLASLLRGSMSKKVDFSRIIILRSGSNFDQPPPGAGYPEVPLHSAHGGYEISLENLYRTGIAVVEGILGQWHEKFKAGIPPKNYVGDIFGSLGGKPDFGPYAPKQ